MIVHGTGSWQAWLVLVAGAARHGVGLPCQHDEETLKVLELQAVIPAKQHLLADHVLEAMTQLVLGFEVVKACDGEQGEEQEGLGVP